MVHRASTFLPVAPVATAPGFGLIGGPVGAMARVFAGLFFARFVVSLFGGARPAIGTVHHVWPGQFFASPQSSMSLPHEK